MGVASGRALALAWPHAWGGASLLAAVGAGNGFSPFVIDGVRCGRCGYCDGRPFAGCPDFDKPYGVLYPHVLVGVFEEVFLNLCIGQANAELVCHSWSQIWSQLVHFLVKRQTSACPRRRAANERIGSRLSCIILLRATLATLGFSSLTASARMAFSRFSVKSSRCKGPTQFRVTSRNLVSQHSRSWMVVSFACSSTACEYDLQRVRK